MTKSNEQNQNGHPAWFLLIYDQQRVTFAQNP